VVIVALVVVAIGAAIFVTIRSGADGGGSASPSASAPPTTAGPVGELVRLLDRSQSLNFEARYSVTDGSSPSSTAHLWRRPPLARLDTESGTGDAARRSAQIITTSGPVACAQSGGGAWSCAPKPGMKVGDVGIVSNGLVSQLAALQVVARDDTIGATAVRCFTVTNGAATTTTPAPAESAEVCVTTDGVAARVVAGTTRLELVSVDRARPADAVFQPPA